MSTDTKSLITCQNHHIGALSKGVSPLSLPFSHPFFKKKNSIEKFIQIMLILHIFILCLNMSWPFLLPPKLFLLCCSLPQRRATKPNQLPKVEPSTTQIAFLAPSSPKSWPPQYPGIHPQNFCPSLPASPSLEHWHLWLDYCNCSSWTQACPRQSFLHHSQIDFPKCKAVCIILP